MLDHTGIVVDDFTRSRAWYVAALAPFGYGMLWEFPRNAARPPDVAGFGEKATGKPDFWISAATPTGTATRPPLDVAFRASNHAVVDSFSKAAISAGGQDNGAPGLRPHYHPNYYGAFVLDPDGHNIEAVCHTAE